MLRRFPKNGRKVIEYAYVSGQCRQITIFARMNDYSTLLHIYIVFKVELTTVALQNIV